jgi:hypothetical protein
MPSITMVANPGVRNREIEDTDYGNSPVSQSIRFLGHVAKHEPLQEDRAEEILSELREIKAMIKDLSEP